MAKVANLIDADDVERAYRALVDHFANEGEPISPAGIRDIGLLESACHRPETSIGKTQKYPTIPAKAASLLHSLILNHPFHNGNKRTALVTLLMFLDLNEKVLEATEDELFDLVLRIASRDPAIGKDSDAEVEWLGRWIRERIRPRSDRIGDMKVADFLAQAKMCGASVKKSSTSFVVRNGTNSVNISRSTKKLARAVVRQYLVNLKLSAKHSGVNLTEFASGEDAADYFINKFRVTLRRLASL